MSFEKVSKRLPRDGAFKRGFRNEEFQGVSRLFRGFRDNLEGFPGTFIEVSTQFRAFHGSKWYPLEQNSKTLLERPRSTLEHRWNGPEPLKTSWGPYNSPGTARSIIQSGTSLKSLEASQNGPKTLWRAKFTNRKSINTSELFQNPIECSWNPRNAFETPSSFIKCSWSSLKRPLTPFKHPETKRNVPETSGRPLGRHSTSGTS